jgi:hypothetical protein
MALGLNLRPLESAGPGRLAIQNYLSPADILALKTLCPSTNSSL